ncbi:fibronectin type III domain-containing protein [Nitrosarchaeum koreense]|nr:fibronectin type III domain-containing protein [Nitrosarchaeum koreense]
MDTYTLNRKSYFGICFGVLLLISIVSVQMAYAEPMFSFKFGTFGTANNQLKNPHDVDVSSDGRSIYVTDTDNHRIIVFDDDGDYDYKFGTFCNMTSIQNCNDDADGADNDGDGQFNNPFSGVLDGIGNFFVIDSDNERVQRFDDGDGQFESKFGSSDNTKPEYLGSAQGIAIQKSTKKIFVSSIETDSISVFDSSGTFVTNFKTFNGTQTLTNPSHMIIDDSEETLYVSDTGNDRIIAFKLVTGTTCPTGTTKAVDGICYIKKFGSAGTADGKFDSPSGLAIDSTNDLLYVADTDNNRIQIFKLTTDTTCASGTSKVVDGVCFVEKFGSAGTADGKFDSPLGLALDTTHNLLYVADTDNSRIQAFTLVTASQTPGPPKNLKTSPVSTKSVLLTWDEPVLSTGSPAVTGYKIEYKTATTAYAVLIADTKSISTSFLHEGLDSSNTYTYQIYAINSKGTSTPSSSSSVKPTETTVPSGLLATAISPNQIRLSWQAPSNTFGQSIGGYTIQRVVGPDVYDNLGSTNSKTTTYTVNNLTTDKSYSFVVRANIGYGVTEPSNTASATPKTTSVDVPQTQTSSNSAVIQISSPPIKLTATSTSSTQINLSWSPPSSTGNTPITGYKIETKKDSGSYSVLVANTNSTSTTYSHTNLTTNSKYTYKVYAINEAGTSTASNEVTTIPTTTLKINPLGKLTIDEGKLLSFAVKLTDPSMSGMVFSLEKNPPTGASINQNNGMFSWTPNDTQGGKAYIFDIVANLGSLSDRQSIIITVNDSIKKSDPIKEPEPPKDDPIDEPVKLEIASFVDPTRDPQSYVDRYNNEPSYKKWFDDNFPEYSSIHEAVGLDTPKGLAPFVDTSKDPQSYVDRYNNEPSYKKWFDDNFPEYSSIYEAVGLDKPKTDEPKTDTPKIDEPKTDTPKIDEPKFGICGPGTKLIDGICTIVDMPKPKPWWQFW